MSLSVRRSRALKIDIAIEVGSGSAATKQKDNWMFLIGPTEGTKDYFALLNPQTDANQKQLL